MTERYLAGRQDRCTPDDGSVGRYLGVEFHFAARRAIDRQQTIMPQDQEDLSNHRAE